MSSLPRNVGGLATARPTIRPTNKAATSGYDLANSVAVDRRGYGSALLYVSVGAAVGTPTTLAVDVKVQESPDGTSNWVDVPGAATTQVVAVNGNRAVELDLSSRLGFIRAVPQVAFTGGSTPSVGLSAHFVLGGAVIEPVTHA